MIGAFADAERAVAALGGRADTRRAAVLPRAAVSDGARLALRDAGIECLTTLEGGGLAEARGLARELAEMQGWRLVEGGADGAAAAPPATWSAGTSCASRAPSPPTGRSPGSTTRASTSPRSICSARGGSISAAASSSSSG